MNYLSKRYIIICGVIFLLAGNLAHLLFPDTYWILTDLHSSVEAIGAACALLLALLILRIRKYHSLGFFYVWIICGLTGMGILDLFHSLVNPGEAFVWLHSIAVLTGGLFFAMVWVPERKIPVLYSSLLPKITFITALISGLLSVVLPDFMPAMQLEEGGFTQTALFINFSGGLFFIAAAAWFIKEYFRDKAFDSLLFSVNSFLFGVSGLLFYVSDQWDIGWWHWHAVRIAAYLISIYFAFGMYKKLTEQIQDQKDKAQKYLDVAASILAVVDVHESVVLINRKGCMLLGYREEEITGSNWFDTFLPEKSRNDARLFFRKLTADAIDQYTHSENPVLTKKGDERLIAWHNTLLKDEAGNVKSVLFSGEDVTDRKKAEDDLWKAHLLLEERVKERTAALEKANDLLKESERRFRETLTTINMIAVQLDTNGDIIFANDFLSKLSGWEKHEIAGRNWMDIFISPAIRDEIKALHKKNCVTGNVTEYYDNEILLKDGQRRLISWSNSRLMDPGGNVIGITSIGADITERKKMEGRIRASLNEKEVLLQEIHHRVKNNLTVIASLLKLQADKVKDEHYRELFNESINRIKTMALIHEKLYRSDDLARIVFSDYLRDMMDNIVGSYGINARRVHFKKELERIILPLDTSIPCGLIVNELLSNSLKYAFPDGMSGEIIVSLRKNNGHVELTVGDNGVGLPADLDFRNAGSLGLNIVNALVKQVRGDIELHAERGTEFLITFGSDN